VTRGNVPSLDASVAAVVVSWNTREALGGCLRSLLAEGVTPIVVADNASSDGSAEVAERFGPPVRVLRTGANLGYGRAANRALAFVDTPWVLVANADVEVAAGSVARLVERLRADDRLGLVGPRLMGPDGTAYPSARRFPGWSDGIGHALLARWWPKNPFTRRYHADGAPGRVVDWVSGACFVARSDALARIGGFDERYFLYFEDVDLCWRLRRAGFQVGFEPDAVVVHAQGLASSKRPIRAVLAHHRSLLRWLWRSSEGSRRWAVVAITPAVALRAAVVIVATLRRRPAGDAAAGRVASVIVDPPCPRAPDAR
jgi:N-acetylglucosaminyl-diphospho-decaprenol L-rhamnosyltransferase